jgi:5-methyltetrahydropteroyltriglutamate--homocysteine methyltransferase
MRNSTTSIITSHAGRLPIPPGCEDLPWRIHRGEAVDEGDIEQAVADVVRRQADIGIGCIGDGEFWKARTIAYYGSHLSGIETRPLKPGEVATTRNHTRERDEFRGFYADMDRLGTLFFVPGEKPMPPDRERMIASGPIKAKGTGAIDRELRVFKAALAQAGRTVDEAFFCVIAPGWLDHFIYNEYYRSDEEFLFALAEALREEYRAVVNAGFILQIDDPGLVDWWDMIKPAISVAEYRKFAKVRVDAINHALAGIPEEKVRYHLCWGSWHGPHTHDLPLEHITDLLLEVKAQAYSFEAANVRHEHEWKVWRNVKLPAGKYLMPGVVSHATNLVEHPEVVADRILNFANVVGRENVIAGTDCGLGTRVHAEIAWAKLDTLVKGAALATKALWPSGK